jgi:uncharacterized protein YdiU (UPF0061 family)
MEAYDPARVFSSIDYQGRYAYANQSYAANWNLMRLAQTFLPLLQHEDGTEEAALASANEALAAFRPQFEAAHSAGLRRKIGLLTEQEGDTALAQDLLDRMAANRADFTLTFRRLCDAAAAPQADATVRALFADPAAFDAWAAGWHARLEKEPASPQELAAAMRAVNPAFIPRNHMVEAALDAAVERQDFQPFEELLDVVSRPYEDRRDRERYTTPARPEECVTQTFCGT